MRLRKYFAACTMAVAALGATVAVTSVAPASAADPAVLKFGSFTPPKAKYLQKITIPWLRRMEADSAGTLKFQEFWGGALIRSPRKQWEGLMNGIQDASQVLPSYTAKLFPDFGFFDLPLLFHGVGSEEASTVGWKMFERGLIGGLDEVHVLALYSNDNGGLHFNRKIETLDGIKGFKVRVPGPKQAAVVQELGLVPVGMGTPQVAGALNRGVIQGTLTGWSALNTFRITPLIKTHLDLPLGVRSFFIAVRKVAYDKLPAKAKESIAKHRGLAISLALGRFYENEGQEMRTKTGDRNTIPVSAEQRKQLQLRLRKFHDVWVKSVVDGEKKYAAIQEILAEVRKK